MTQQLHENHKLDSFHGFTSEVGQFLTPKHHYILLQIIASSQNSMSKQFVGNQGLLSVGPISLLTRQSRCNSIFVPKR